MSPSLKNLVYEKYEFVKLKNLRIFLTLGELRLLLANLKLAFRN